jgi:hypothetical protein
VEERYGLAQQMRRAAVSIPNPAEAQVNGPREYHFIGISRGLTGAAGNPGCNLAVMLGFTAADWRI